MQNLTHIDKGIESLNRILLMMGYDMSKTYSENIELLSEQKPDEMMPGQIERFGYKQDKPETLRPALDRQQQHIQSVSNYFMTWDKHDWLDLASVAVLLIPEAGLLISFAIDSYNAALYLQEGKKFEAGLRFAFALLPGTILFAKIPFVRKYGKEMAIKVLSKFSRAEKLFNGTAIATKEEIEFVQQVEKLQPWLKSSAELEVVTQITKLFLDKNTPLAFFGRFCWLVYKNNKIFRFLTNIITWSFLSGGIEWTFPKLAASLGLEPTDCPNNIYGFKKTCRLYGITFKSFNDELKKGIAKDLDGNLQKFYYNPKKKIFESDVTKNIGDQPTPENIENYVLNGIKESNVNTDSLVKEMFSLVGNDSILSKYSKQKVSENVQPQTNIKVPTPKPATKVNNLIPKNYFETPFPLK